ncbi:hypothetical protein [uncultured Hymenobacter sp.]|uniref:hypothetical protein n=1 Tax=uncultured Hymenobacter sp. TaxID=170016 RepID=UPI0035CBC213
MSTNSTPPPEHQRAPRLSSADLHQALEELDAKIQTLRQRAHATAAGSPATYLEHANALEAKRAQLAAQLHGAPAPAEGAAEPGAWAQVRHGISVLRDDLKNIL